MCSIDRKDLTPSHSYELEKAKKSSFFFYTCQRDRCPHFFHVSLRKMIRVQHVKIFDTSEQTVTQTSPTPDERTKSLEEEETVKDVTDHKTNMNKEGPGLTHKN